MATEERTNEALQQQMINTIYKAMRYRHLSVQMLASISGVGYATLHRSLHEHTTFNPQVYEKLMKAMKIEYTLTIKLPE